jgi:glutamate dehydrogenase/leucine dehydrogenase
MIDIIKKAPELLIEYTDPIEGFKGWLAIDKLSHKICAGGLRVQKGLTSQIVSDLAATMTLKMRIAEIRADGAKSGIDYDPNSPGKEEALYRFLRAIRPFLLERYSMGPDLNTKMKELDRITKRLGISSIKNAIARAQGIGLPSFLNRYKILEQTAGFTTLGNLRSGFGTASACLGVLEYLNIPYNEATVAIQGFGGLGGAAAYSLYEAGVRIIAVADREKSIFESEQPLDIPTLLRGTENGILPYNDSFGIYKGREEIFDVTCDVLIPAAIENVITADNAHNLDVKGIVCGANLATTREAEEILHKRGVIVIPDLVAGSGGSVSMDGLFGPIYPPSVQDVLDHVDNKMRTIIKNVVKRSQQDDLVPREAALKICDEAPIYPEMKPYGRLEDASLSEH